MNCLSVFRQAIAVAPEPIQLSKTNEEFYKQALKRIETNVTQLSLFDD